VRKPGWGKFLNEWSLVRTVLNCWLASVTRRAYTLLPGKPLRIPAKCGFAVLAALLASVSNPGDLKADQAKDGCRGQDLGRLLLDRNPELSDRLHPTPEEARNTQAVLWRIEKDGVAPSYLFGTIHVTDERITNVSDRVRSALEGARMLALEVAEFSPAATANAVVSARDMVLLEDGDKLDELLSEQEFALIRKKLADRDVPEHLARLFKPWVVGMILAVSDCERAQIAKGREVLDVRLATIARENGIPVVGLETIEEQLAAASQVPVDEQLQLLRASLAYSRRSMDLAETVIRLYLDRKMSHAIPLQSVLAERSGLNASTLRQFQRHMVERRNAAIAAKIAPLIEQGGLFIAVGALHLPGREGLVALIRRTGFRVLPIE